ncbi:MAG: hydrogenase nickel incorporation protein HypA [bacterium]|nr:hydrogenase nickel incorporation protein HypA [bacterium]
MHEWALAEGVVTAALDAAAKQKLVRVTKLVVRVGALQRISPDFFRKALSSVLPEDDPRLESVEFELSAEPAVMGCRGCGHTFEPGQAGDLDADQLEAIHFIPELAHGYLSCPKCESSDFDVRQGRGIWLDAVEGER